MDTVNDTTGFRLFSIPTGELRLLLRNAEANGFADASHTNAYRAEIARRESLAVAAKAVL